MTASTRYRLTFCLIVGLLALPVEALLLPVARTPEPAAAAAEWTAGLDTSALRDAASNIDAYPAVYRRAIMSALTPEDRADAWRAYFTRELQSREGLTEAQRSVLRDAVGLASPDAFRAPMADGLKAEISSVFARAAEAFGKDAAAELFVTLGPKQLTRASALPLTQQLADRVRGWRAASARQEEDMTDCNCNPVIDTCDLTWDPWLECSELFTCEFDLVWPMCGPLWSWACTGWCRVIRWPEGSSGSPAGGGE
jgi:hypothetical protein